MNDLTALAESVGVLDPDDTPTVGDYAACAWLAITFISTTLTGVMV
ncbi:hypothetical protein [Corynebacterium qintianiae]|nr:hypothetical protein [Corynebacterium qintianiae]